MQKYYNGWTGIVRMLDSLINKQPHNGSQREFIMVLKKPGRLDPERRRTMRIQEIEKRYGVKVKSGDEWVQGLQTQIKTYEFKYHCTSQQMMESVMKDPSRENEETCRWLQMYTVLNEVTKGKNTGGTHSTITNKSSTTV